MAHAGNLRREAEREGRKGLDDAGLAVPRRAMADEDEKREGISLHMLWPAEAEKLVRLPRFVWFR